MGSKLIEVRMGLKACLDRKGSLKPEVPKGWRANLGLEGSLHSGDRGGQMAS